MKCFFSPEQLRTVCRHVPAVFFVYHSVLLVFSVALSFLLFLKDSVLFCAAVCALLCEEGWSLKNTIVPWRVLHNTNEKNRCSVERITRWNRRSPDRRSPAYGTEQYVLSHCSLLKCKISFAEIKLLLVAVWYKVVYDAIKKKRKVVQREMKREI